MKIGLVGLGRMGRAIHTRLAETGCEILAWDRDAGAMQAAAANQVRLAGSVQDVASFADIVLSSITEDSGVRALFLGEGGFLARSVRGKLFVEMSTLRPATARELAPAVEAAGARLIDAPVFGSVPHAKAGKLYAMVGGRDEDLEHARPVLERLAHKIAHMGPNGAGYAMKLTVNLGLAAYIQAVAEALALGQSEGLALDRMLHILGEAPTANSWLAAKKDVLTGEPADITLDLKTMRKDIMSMVATGTTNGTGLPLASAALTTFSAAVAHGWGDKDIGELPRFFREHMGQRFK